MRIGEQLLSDSETTGREAARFAAEKGKYRKCETKVLE